MVRIVCQWAGGIVEKTSTHIKYSSVLANEGTKTLEQYSVGDTVLIRPENKNQPPFICEIGSLYEDKKTREKCFSAKWFYRQHDIDSIHLDHLNLSTNEILYSTYKNKNELNSIISKCHVIYLPTEFNLPQNLDFSRDDIFVCRYDYNTSRVPNKVEPISLKLLSDGHDCALFF